MTVCLNKFSYKCYVDSWDHLDDFLIFFNTFPHICITYLRWRNFFMPCSSMCLMLQLRSLIWSTYVILCFSRLSCNSNDLISCHMMWMGVLAMKGHVMSHDLNRYMLWHHVTSHDMNGCAMKGHVMSHDVNGCAMTSCDVTWCDWMCYDIIWCHMTWMGMLWRVIWCHMTWWIDVLWHCMTSQDVIECMSHNTTGCAMTSYLMMCYEVIWRHVFWCYNSAVKAGQWM